jgi:hypothetical protein
MKRRLGVGVLLIAALCSAQEGHITIRLLNGRTGKAIRDKSFNVWLGNGKMLLLTPNQNGEIVLDASNVQPREIRVLPNTRFDCRFERDVSSGSRITYSLNEILSRGAVTENFCGNHTASPTPGVLTVFLRPRSFIELFKM